MVNKIIDKISTEIDGMSLEQLEELVNKTIPAIALMIVSGAKKIDTQQMLKVTKEIALIKEIAELRLAKLRKDDSVNKFI
jgi:hypothetical protein